MNNWEMPILQSAGGLGPGLGRTEYTRGDVKCDLFDG